MGYNNLQQVPPLEISIEYPIDAVKEALKTINTQSYKCSYTVESKNENFGVYKYSVARALPNGVIASGDVTVTVKPNGANTIINISTLNKSASMMGGVDIATSFLSERQTGFLSGLSAVLNGKSELTPADFDNSSPTSSGKSGCAIAIIVGVASSLYYLFQ